MSALEIVILASVAYFLCGALVFCLVILPHSHSREFYERMAQGLRLFPGANQLRLMIGDHQFYALYMTCMFAVCLLKWPEAFWPPSRLS